MLKPNVTAPHLDSTEHVFAVQKDKMDHFIRTVGIARATAKIGMANLVYSGVTRGSENPSG
jgi:hypothetical protein